jgi:hypothetical protein
MRPPVPLFLVLLASLTVHAQVPGPGAPADTTLWRDFMVTTTADSGPGSLRQAILDINAECTVPAGSNPPACRARFDIEPKLGGDFFHTIQLLTPLPALDVPRSSIDGSLEDQSNTLGPSIALDGSRLTDGNGITVASGESDIKAIAVGNFPQNGVYAGGTARVNVDRAYVGVNALGLVATPNGSRGITTERVAGTITNCLIAGNRRSGIFMAGPLGGGVQIRNNRIGVASVNGFYGIPNGASGIFIGPYDRGSESTLIEDNVIAGNEQFGIALANGAQALARRNRIYANGLGGIDIGLDGPTLDGIDPAPVITSATYANGQTTITGLVPSSATATTVELFANSEIDADGFAEGEEILGTVPVMEGQFALTVPRDLRGKSVNGVALTTSVSEFGRALPVQ